MPTDDGLNGSGTDTQPMPAIIRIGWRAGGKQRKRCACNGRIL
jgi:hypothetical protein